MVIFSKDEGGVQQWRWQDLAKCPNPAFYKLGELSLMSTASRDKKEPITAPTVEGVLLSINSTRNLGDGAPHTGERRMRSVRVVLEWHLAGAAPMTVALSLDEAASLRVALQQAWMKDDVHVALRVLGTATLLGATPGCPGAHPAGTPLNSSAREALEVQRLALRFFNCDSFFKPAEIQVLKRTFSGVAPQDLERFFRAALACRRRRLGNTAAVLKLFPARAGDPVERVGFMKFALISPSRRRDDADREPLCAELSSVRLLDDHGSELTPTKIEFGDAPNRTGDVQNVLAGGDWPEKKLTEFHPPIAGQSLVVFTFPRPVEVAAAVVTTTNDESFGGDARLQAESGGQWTDLLTATAGGGLSIIYLAEGGRRHPE